MFWRGGCYSLLRRAPRNRCTSIGKQIFSLWPFIMGEKITSFLIIRFVNVASLKTLPRKTQWEKTLAKGKRVHRVFYSPWWLHHFHKTYINPWEEINLQIWHYELRGLTLQSSRWIQSFTLLIKPLVKKNTWAIKFTMPLSISYSFNRTILWCFKTTDKNILVLQDHRLWYFRTINLLYISNQKTDLPHVLSPV